MLDEQKLQMFARVTLGLILPKDAFFLSFVLHHRNRNEPAAMKAINVDAAPTNRAVAFQSTKL